MNWKSRAARAVLSSSQTINVILCDILLRRRRSNVRRRRFSSNGLAAVGPPLPRPTGTPSKPPRPTGTPPKEGNEGESPPRRQPPEDGTDGARRYGANCVPQCVCLRGRRHLHDRHPSFSLPTPFRAHHSAANAVSEAESPPVTDMYEESTTCLQ